MPKIAVMIIDETPRALQVILLNRTGEFTPDQVNDLVAGIDGFIDCWSKGYEVAGGEDATQVQEA